MKMPSHNDPMDALGAIYEKMYEYTVDNFHNVENKTEQLAHKLIDEAKDNAIRLEKVTQKEADELARYLKRDLSDTATFLAKSGNELKGWLGYETTLLENELLDLLLKIADKTTVNLLQLKESTQPLSEYYSGEITGPGTLICDECGEKIYLYKAGTIPVCSKCNDTKFHRNI
ncbi:MAG: zinc ribbon-containing protein [Gammaproteobacteria bacterium]